MQEQNLVCPVDPGHDEGNIRLLGWTRWEGRFILNMLVEHTPIGIILTFETDGKCLGVQDDIFTAQACTE